MVNSPRVSAIIATYHWPKALRCALASVLGQTFADFEVIVVGDGCTDETAETVAAAGDPRVRWHNLETNHGHQSAANNAGLALARGRWIAYLGHDDLWRPTHLDDLVAVAEGCGADLAWSLAMVIGPQPFGFRGLGSVPRGEGYDPDAIVYPGNVLHRRELGVMLGGWRHHRESALSPDQDFLRRAHGSGAKMVCLERVTLWKFPAAMRRGCYTAGTADEQEACLARMGTEPDFAERELLALAAFRERREPTAHFRMDPSRSGCDRRGAVIENARHLRGVASAPGEPERFPPVESGRITLHGSKGVPYLWYGWSSSEATHRWTDGPEAALVFAAEPGCDLLLRMEVAPYLGEGKRARILPDRQSAMPPDSSSDAALLQAYLASS